MRCSAIVRIKSSSPTIGMSVSLLLVVGVVASAHAARGTKQTMPIGADDVRCWG